MRTAEVSAIMMSTKRLTAYNAGKHGWLVPVEIRKQRQSHFCCLWNTAVRKWHERVQ